MREREKRKRNWERKNEAERDKKWNAAIFWDHLGKREKLDLGSTNLS